VRLLLANIARIPAADDVRAQRHRHLVCERFTALLREVDVIVTPTNGCTAPPIRDDALKRATSTCSRRSCALCPRRT
jgi:Asp-tRNA(Asn)/Glu-tRNA(Gln) amidotransferase A subunit family amidase